MGSSDLAAPGPVPAAGEALYLYCLTRFGSLPDIEGPGVDGEHPLSLVPFRDVAAVVSVVRVDDFCGAEAEARMKDLPWVGSRVQCHHQIVEHAMRHSAVVPLPFAVLFSSRERLLAWVGQNHDAISRALDRFTGHEEWAVKGTLDRQRAEAGLASTALRGAPGSTASGARYLEERASRAAAGRELDAWLRDVVGAITGELSACAAEFREREIPAWAAEDQGIPVVNWAFLVPRSARDALAARIGSINAVYADRGLTLHLSGPWPPYSFCPSLEPEPSG